MDLSEYIQSKKFYIYLRFHESYANDKVIKMGECENMYDRDSTYATG